MKLSRPIGQRIMVEMVEEEKDNTTASGLVLPGGPTKIMTVGRVLMVGEGVKLDITEGNLIFFAPGSAFGLDPNDKIKLVDAASVYAVVER